MSLALLALSALLFSLSFPGFVFVKGAGVFAWICFVPLFLACDRISLKKSPLYGFFYGFLSYGLLTYWLWNYSPWIFLLATFFYGLLYAALMPLWVFTGITLSKSSFFVRALILISFEYIKTLGFLGFSYGITGYTQWKNTGFIQIADVTGVYGISAIIIFTNAVIARFIKVIKLRRDFRKKVLTDFYNHKYTTFQFEVEMAALKKRGSLWPVITTSVILTLIISGTFLYGKRSAISFLNLSENSKTLKICAVQHNENAKENGIQSYAQNIRRLTNLTDEALSLYPDIDIVVWPETAVTPSIMYQYYNGKDENRIKLVKTLLEYMEKKDCSFVTGNFHRDEKGDFNSALYFTPHKNVLPPNPEIYSKNHLVPLSEEYPFGNMFPHLKRFLEKLGASFWNRGNEIKVFDNKKGFKFATPICFEDTFPSICRKMAQKGAGAFINLTNDSWGKSEACQNQHLALATFRSVENHVVSVRSATSGQTCVIDEKGNIVSQAASFCESFVVQDIKVKGENEKLTFYTKYGDVFSLVLCMFTAVMLIMAAIRGIISLCQNR